MDFQEFLENFANQFDEVNTSEIDAETSFRELEEWDSLSALSIIAMINEKYDVVMTGAALRNATTIKELYDLVNSKL